MLVILNRDSMAFEITISHGGTMINFWPSNRSGSSFEIDKFWFRCSFQCLSNSVQCAACCCVFVQCRQRLCYTRLAIFQLTSFVRCLTQKFFVCEIAALQGIFQGHCFINSFSFKHGSVHFHSNFMQMRSIFSMVAVSDFGKGLLVDERCQATLFAVYLFCSIRLYLEDHHQVPLWKRNIASFIFVSALCSFQTFAIESSMDLIFNTIVNCICFVRVLWSHCH